MPINKNILLVCFFIIGKYFFCFAQDDMIKDTIGGEPGFGGPASVPGQLKRVLRLQQDIAKPYYNFKTQLTEKAGFTYSINYYSILQSTTASADTNFYAGGTFTASFYWAIAGRRSGNIGALVFQTENYHLYSSKSDPLGLSSSIGYIGQTAEGYSKNSWFLTNLYWEQNFYDYHLTFLAGILDATAYFNSYALVDSRIDFFNLAFSNDLTVPFPDQGLGIAVFGMLSSNVYLMGGLFDANGYPTDPIENFASFFNSKEYFTNIEFGWIRSLKNPFSENIHLNFWYANDRKLDSIASGWGLTFSWNQLIAERWEPFIRFGFASEGGALWEKSFALGFGYRISDIVKMLGVGLNWSKPYASIPGDMTTGQFTSELYCRFYFRDLLTISPDIQLLINPALNKKKDAVFLFGLRAQITI